MRTAYLGLGSNSGPRQRHLQAAVDGVAGAEGFRVTAVSPVYETEAHTLDPEAEQRPFLNAVVEASIERAPEVLLALAHELERREGRRREDADRWAPRPLDVDLLAVGDATRRTERLTLPHPRIAERRFVLRPWADLAPDFVVPAPFEAPVQDLLDACPDTAAIRRRGKELDRGTGDSPADE
jgi:2-amino-4-hydroxy-6-hydroxymethyldihydropteridine diphosphokinase